MSVDVPLETFWIPPDLIAGEIAVRPELVNPAGGPSIEIRRPELDAARLHALTLALRQRARQQLAKRPIRTIIDALDRVAALWLDPGLPERRIAVTAISAMSGFSAPMVEHALVLEFESSRGIHLERALRSELGDPAVLDGFVADGLLGGRLRAIGPELVGGIASANIPGLPHLTVTRALLVKSSCLMRSSRDEPLFLPLFARTLARVDPELAGCLAVVDFDPADERLEQAFLEGLDHLIAYGGAETIASLSVRLPARVGATWHGHRLGFTVIARGALAGDLDELAERVAYDFVLFDREACLSPQACFVEIGGNASPRDLAAAIGRALERWEERLPARALSTGDLARRRQTLDTLALRAAALEPVEVVCDGPRHAVVIEPLDALIPAPRGRFVRVVPVSDARAVLPLLEPVRDLLQVAVIEDPEDRIPDLLEALARLGVSRITRAGLAGLPSMMWRHDGTPCLARLLRWVGEERSSPAERAAIR